MPPSHTFALFWSQCLSDSVRRLSWHPMLTNLFLVIVRFAIDSLQLPAPAIITFEGNETFDWLKLTDEMC